MVKLKRTYFAWCDILNLLGIKPRFLMRLMQVLFKNSISLVLLDLLNVLLMSTSVTATVHISKGRFREKK